MTQPESPDIEADRIRETAAAWVARIEGRRSPRLQRKLERWLAADPRHEVAYRRMSQRFDGARALRGSQRYATRPPPARRTVRTKAVLTALAAAMIALAFLLTDAGRFSSKRSVQQTGRELASIDQSGLPRGRRVAAPAAAIGTVGLEDGSIVTLDTGSAIDVTFGRGSRRITLLRGRARFDVAHDGRPFTVSAGGGLVTARGTVFDVSISSQGRVGVALLRGSIDVLPAARAQSATVVPAVRRLVAGDSVAYSGGSLLSQPLTAQARDQRWIDGAVEFDNVSLGYLIDRGNQGAGPPIRMSDPSLARLRVSGHFDVTNRERLAKNLATLFDLRIAVRPGSIELRR